MKDLIFLCLLLILSNAESCTFPICNPNDLSNFYLNGFTFVCEAGKVCNIKQKKPETCPPCVKKAASSCSDIYACSNGNVVINGGTFSCPENYGCVENTPQCVPCTRMQCPAEWRKVWTCFASAPRRVNYQNTNQVCPVGTICNKDYVMPCYPCISNSTIV